MGWHQPHREAPPALRTDPEEQDDTRRNSLSPAMERHLDRRIEQVDVAIDHGHRRGVREGDWTSCGKECCRSS